MLKLTIIEFIFRAIPESFLAVFAIATFSRIRLSLSKYLSSSCILLVLISLIRSLPINYGVHTILIIITCILLNHFLNEIDIIKCIKSAILVLILQLICEGLNILIIEKLLGNNIVYIFSNPTLKVIYGLPSLFILWVFTLGCFFMLKKKRKLLYV